MRMATRTRLGVSFVFGAVLTAASAGCAASGESEDLDSGARISPEHVLLRIGHARSPKDDLVWHMDGTKEPAWSRLPGESAVTAVDLYVRGAPRCSLKTEEFREVRRFRVGNLEKLVLERERAKDFAGRLFLVQLFKDGESWIPELILVCQESPRRRHLRDF